MTAVWGSAKWISNTLRLRSLSSSSTKLVMSVFGLKLSTLILRTRRVVGNKFLKEAGSLTSSFTRSISFLSLVGRLCGKKDSFISSAKGNNALRSKAAALGEFPRMLALLTNKFFDVASSSTLMVRDRPMPLIKVNSGKGASFTKVSQEVSINNFSIELAGVDHLCRDDSSDFNVLNFSMSTPHSENFA